MSAAGARPKSGEGVGALGLALALAVLAAVGLAWWRDRSRAFETPVWDATRLVPLAPATASEMGERWVVAVNLRCPHCQAHLRALAHRIEPRAHPPSLAALVVDEPARPARAELGVPLRGGVWWDSAQVWRDSWGRRVYGETFRFDAAGRLLSSTPAGTLPDSAVRLP